MGIPKIIHQIWLQGKDQIPERYHILQESWLKNHKEWEYMLWEGESIERLLSIRFPWFLQTYREYRHLHQRVDAGRYFILYQYGGFYADIDTKSIKPLDILLEKHREADMITSELPFSSFENRLIKTILGTRVIITNAIIGTSKHFYVLDNLLHSLRKSRNRFSFLKELNITYSTGPAFFSLLLDKYLKADNRIKVLPHYYFESRFSYDKGRKFDKNSFVEHQQEATWHSDVLKYVFNSYYLIKNMFRRY